MNAQFYEIKLLTKANQDAGDVSTMVRGVCESISGGLTNVGTTIHNRPSRLGGPNNSVAGAVVLSTKSKQEVTPIIDEFGGVMARLHGLPTLGAQELGETTLNLKDDEDAIEAFVQDALEDEPDSDDEFYITPPDRDDGEDIFETNGENR